MKAQGVSRRGRGLLRLTGMVRKAGGQIYLVLAAIFSLVIIGDFGVSGFLNAAETRMFDTLVANRIRVPAPDPEIVIVDIDEASLAAMAPEYGRWPWPNAVLGELVAAVEKQGPRAIVFDILFSDFDTQRPKSDEAFNASIAATGNSFFPILRLDPRNDALSRIQPGMVPGVRPLGGDVPADEKATVAMILPKVPAAIDNGRLGTTQVVPDRDGIVRRYPSWIAHAGWRIPSMPTRIAEDFGFPGAAQQEVLLNWRGPPFSYRYIGFGDLYKDLVKGRVARPAGEFRNKILIIGSTAPSLFDIKGTPVARIHPGVEILATAVDNFKHGDWLRERPRWVMVGAALALIWSMAFALYRRIRVDVFDSLFGGLQAGLLVVAYATLNLSDWYIDTSAPLSLGVMYFTVARLYHGVSLKALANAPVQDLAQLAGGRRCLGVLAVRLDGATKTERRRLERELDVIVARSKAGAARIVDLVEDPGFVRSVFADSMMLYWLSEGAEAELTSAMDEAEIELKRAITLMRWGGRLGTGRVMAEMVWNEPQGWQPIARRTILAALAAVAGAPERDG